MTQVFPPETNAGAKRAFALAGALAEEFDLLVVTLLPSYPNPEMFASVNIGEHDRALSFKVNRIGKFRPHSGKLLIRGMREYSTFAEFSSAAKSFTPDVIVATSPSMFLGPIACRAARSLDVPFLWDLRDLTWQYALDRPSSSPVTVFGKRWLKKHMAQTVAVADQVTCTNRGMEGVLREEYGRQTGISTIPNGVSKAAFRDLDVGHVENDVLRKRITYVGALGHMQDLVVLLKAARQLPEYDFHLVGDGAARKELQDFSEGHQIENVTFHGYLDAQGVARQYAMADLLVGHLVDTDVLAKTAMPTKIFEYMATGKPFIFGCRGHAAEFLQAEGVGVPFSPGDPSVMSGAIRTAVQNLGDMREMAKRARRYVGENLIREECVRGIVPIIDRMIRR